MLALLALGLAACSTGGPQLPSIFGPTQEQPPQPEVVPLLPPAFPPQDIVGRWGLAAYHKDEDRPRIEAAAAKQCKQPYVITLGPTGGVMMHLADQATPTELRLKGAPGDKTYIGPEGDPPGGDAGPRGGVLRRPRADPALDGSGSAGPLRHHGLCALRAGRRQAAAEAKPKPKPKPQAASRKPQPAKPVQPPIQQRKP